VTIATDNYQGRAPEFRKEQKPEHQEAGMGSILAIEGLVELGMSEMQAIVAGTKNGAIAAGMLDSIGTVETGKEADLILLGADPLDDISNIRKLEHVIARGRLVDLATLPQQRLFYLGDGRQSGDAEMPEAAVAAMPVAAAAVPEKAPEPVQLEENTENKYGNALPVNRAYKNNLEKIVVEMQNGQVWRQLNSDNTRVVMPSGNDGLTADIERGFLGSVLLEISGTGRSFKVSKIR
jgi:hypothetical protein